MTTNEPIDEMTTIETINYWKINNQEMYDIFIRDCVHWFNKDQTVEEFIESDDFEEEFHHWYETL